MPSFEGMPILRFILTSLMVVAGLVGALLLMAVGLVIFVLNRLFGRPATMPRFQRPVGPSAAASKSAARGDVIDVVATDVKD
jgi:hypothetical protein